MRFHCSDNGRIGGRFIGNDGHGRVEPAVSLRLSHKGFCGLGVALGGEPEINKLAALVNNTPQISPFTGHSDVGLVDMPEHGSGVS